MSNNDFRINKNGVCTNPRPIYQSKNTTHDIILTVGKNENGFWDFGAGIIFNNPVDGCMVPCMPGRAKYPDENTARLKAWEYLQKFRESRKRPEPEPMEATAGRQGLLF